MRGNRMGLYECAGCGEKFTVSDSFVFGGEFRPAAVLKYDGHPMFWRGDRR